MPVQFITSSFKNLPVKRRTDIYRLLHICFDHGYLFEAEELEKIWLKQNPNWRTLPETEHEIWLVIEKAIAPELAGDDFKPQE